jgi:transglutaminase-like putative cysteine protease
MTNPTYYRIQHRTSYQYSEPVVICQNQIRMTPREMSGALTAIHCRSSRLSIEPKPDFQNEHQDYFGNHVISFSIESPHQQLEVTSLSEVEIVNRAQPQQLPTKNWEAIRDGVRNTSDRHWLVVQEYMHDSPRITRSAAFASYASRFFTPKRSFVEAAFALTQQIHNDFSYLPGATHVGTTARESFETRAGVCQDFAHVQIACFRSIGLPSRYVSGYLRTEAPSGGEKLVGADESHAWVSCYAGDAIGWIDFDPTNACFVQDNHIPICVGRDYSEVSPMRGVVIGGGDSKLNVSVDVNAIAKSRQA